MLGGARQGAVEQVGRFFFHRLREADAERWSLWVSESIDGMKRPLVDPETLFESPAPRIAGFYPSPDGRWVAFRLSFRGSSLMPLYLVDVEGHESISEVVPACFNPVAHVWHSHNQVAWLRDGSGFFYTRNPGSVPRDELRYHAKLYFHRIGEDFRSDELVFGRDLTKETTLVPILADEDRLLVVTTHDYSGTVAQSAVFAADSRFLEAGFECLLPAHDGEVEVASFGDAIYMKMNCGDSRWSVCRIFLDSQGLAKPRIETLVAGEDQTTGRWFVAGESVLVETLENFVSKLRVYDQSGAERSSIPLPEGTTLDSIDASQDVRHLFLRVSSATRPTRTLRLESHGYGWRPAPDPHLTADRPDFETRWVWFESADGTSIPMHMVHRRGLVPNGSSPTVIRGYGGFNLSLYPKWRPDIVPFLLHGGVYAIAHIRGGGELGAAWHRAGIKHNKQKSFEDFIAAAEWLIDAGYTSPERLACYGWSHGGLLVTSVAVQRPDLWRAVVAGAPLTDMARFHLAHGARHWLAEYGSPEKDEDLAGLLRYSPYHTLADGADAPAVLIYAPGADDRVAVWHGRKMLARWQAATSSNRPLLLRSPLDVGHQGGTTVDAVLSKYTDIWSFLFWQLGIEVGSDPDAGASKAPQHG